MLHISLSDKCMEDFSIGGVNWKNKIMLSSKKRIVDTNSEKHCENQIN